jgi:hypothetical protein
MPRILPTFAAVIIVGVCIAFNTMRYPVVWEMVGPGASASLSEKNAPPADAASSAKAASSSTADQNSSPPSNALAETSGGEQKNSAPSQTDSPAEKSSKKSSKKTAKKPSRKADSPIAKESEKPSQAIPISLPKEELAAGEAKRDAGKTEKAENNVAPADENLVEPPRRLVPVASDALSAGALGTGAEEIRRLPPVEIVAYPDNRYVAESFNSAIPIYPSTGK